MNGSSHPVQLHIALPEQSSRGLNIPWLGMFIKSILLIPVLILLFFMGIGVYFVLILLQIPMWVILFTGKYPQGLAAWMAGLLQLQTRAGAYMVGLTDTYPGFALDAQVTGGGGALPPGQPPQFAPGQVPPQFAPGPQPGPYQAPPQR
jgi:hypothetical protein